MNKYEGQQRNTGEPVFKIKKETKEPILQLKDKWPRLYDCLACRYRAADIPMTPVNSLEDLLDDEHLRALGFFRLEKHPSEGEVRTIGIPVRFSRTPGDVWRLAPRLDEHREEIALEAAKARRHDP